jgi:predicted nucleotidyltransferase
VLDAEIVKTVQKYLRVLHENGVHARFIVVFGSWVKGRADKWSDIDVIVVAPQYDAGIRHDDAALLWRLAAKVDSRIEPIPCGERQWVEDDSRAIIEIARREGQRIAAEGSPQPAGA